MSNPFQEHFSNDPFSQQRRAAEQERIKEAERQEQEQIKEAEQQELYETAVVAEIERYDSVVMEVLELLRKVAYPDRELHRFEAQKARELTRESYYPTKLEEKAPPITGWWRLGGYTGSYEAHHPRGKDMYTERIAYFEPIVSVGLLMDGNTATHFLATYYGATFPSEGYARKMRANLNREALTQVLIELHKPIKRTEVAVTHAQIATRVLNRIGKLPCLSVIRWSDYRLDLPVGDGLSMFADDPRLRVPTDDSGRKVCVGILREDFSVDGYSTDRGLVSVYVVFDAQDNPTHYECRLEGIDQPVIAQLNEGALYAAIEHALSTLEAEKAKPAQKKNKRWFGL